MALPSGLSGGLFADWIMFVATLLALVAAATYARRKKDYLVAAWTVPLGYLALFYLALVVNVTPICSDAELRVILYRPGMFFLLVFMVLHFINGRLNAAIDEAQQRVARWIKYFKT